MGFIWFCFNLDGCDIIVSCLGCCIALVVLFVCNSVCVWIVVFYYYLRRLCWRIWLFSAFCFGIFWLFDLFLGCYFICCFAWFEIFFVLLFRFGVFVVGLVFCVLCFRLLIGFLIVDVDFVGVGAFIVCTG